MGDLESLLDQLVTSAQTRGPKAQGYARSIVRRAFELRCAPEQEAKYLRPNLLQHIDFVAGEIRREAAGSHRASKAL